MSVIQKYAPVSQQHGSFQALAQSDPRLASQILTELSLSSDPQDQAAYQQLGQQGYVAGGYGGGFVVHQEMKDAMTRQQQAYAAPVVNQPTSNPVYNQVQAQKSEPAITQAPIAVTPEQPPKVIVMKPSNYWTFKPSPSEPMSDMGKPSRIAETSAKIVPPPGERVVSVEPVDNAIEYRTEPIPVPPKDLGEQAKDFVSNFASGIGKVLTGQRQSLPLSGLPVAETLTPQERGAVKTVGLTTVAVLAPVAGQAVGVGALGVAGSEAVGVGINQAIKAVQGGGLLTPEEALQSAAEGGAFALAGAGVMKGIGMAGKALNVGLPATAAGKVAAASGRIGVNTAMGAGAGYVLTGGDVESAKQGALFGAALGVAGEVAGAVAPKMQAKMRESLMGQKAQEHVNKYYEVDV
ncbi:MAG: hypothetical protein WC325_09780, partial [Candidatus Bathyarchaeia archaeon]